MEEKHKGQDMSDMSEGHTGHSGAGMADESHAHAEHDKHASHNQHNGHDKNAGHDMHASHDQHAGHQEHAGHDEHVGHDEHSRHNGHAGHSEHAGGDEHEGHGAHTDHTGHETMFRRRFWISTLISIPVLLYSPAIQNWFGFSVPEFAGSQWLTPVFAVFVFFYGGMPFLKMAVPEIKNRKPGMMTLISLAISVAFIYSIAALFISVETAFFWELVTLIDIMLLGHWMEMRSIRQASGALNELAKLLPDTAERIDPDGNVSEVSVSELQKGDLLLVRPGASIPADGEVVEGESDVNESMITGESLPVKKNPGDQVIAGTINGDGSLRVSVNALGDDTALAGIMRLVEQAQQSKSDTQILADKAAGWLFYVALAVAIITGILWTVGVGFNVEVISRVATVLVIACPHALGLAVPLVVAITTSMGAKNGILVRDRLALETAREIDTVIFDKTGTLTLGEFGVVGISVVDGWSEDDALAMAAAIEGDSEHTIARGIRRSAEVRGLSLPEVSGFEAIKGRGVTTISGGQRFHIGGPRLLEMLSTKMDPVLVEFAESTAARRQSTVYLLKNEQAVAAFALADVIRPESKEAVDKLHAMKIQVAMLTGDSRAVAENVASELGIDQVFAEVLPEDKDQKVSELQAKGQRVAMVGDGVNDAPALTRADVGIAIGGGTDVAIESAGIVLVKSNPLDVVKIFVLSRASYRKMIQNLWWAAGYNIVALPLAAGVLVPWGFLLSPAMGALLMSLSTVVVALNAQLLRRTSLAL